MVSNSLTTRAIVLPILASLLVAGCFVEPEKVFVDPELPVVHEADLGSWQESPVLACGKEITAIAAWTADDLLIGGDDGVVLRWQDGRLTNHNLPGWLDVAALCTAPGGAAYAANSRGIIYRFENDEWKVDRPADPGGRISALWCDPAGTVTAAGNAGRLLRREGGIWSAIDLGVESDLLSIWGLGTDQLWVVGDDGVFIRSDGVNWRADVPFTRRHRFICVSGDAKGRLAILDDDNEVQFYDGYKWDVIPAANNTLYGVMIIEDRLCAYRGLWCEWSGLDWEIDWESWHYHVDAAIALGDLVLFTSERGGICRRAGGQVSVLTEEMRHLDGLAQGPEGMNLITTGGWVFRHKQGLWEREIQLDSYTPGAGRSLVGGEPGVLYALATSHGELFRYEGDAWTRFPDVGPRFSELHRLDDGSLVIESDEHSLWTLRGGVLDQLCWVPPTWGGFIGVAGPSLAEAWVLTQKYLGRFNGVSLEPFLFVDPPGLRGLAHDPQHGLLLFGQEGLFRLGENGLNDITPLLDLGDTFMRAEVLQLAVTNSGDWFAWVAPGKLLRRTATRWESPAGDTFPYEAAFEVLGQVRQLVAPSPREAFLVGVDFIFRYGDHGTDGF